MKIRTKTGFAQFRQAFKQLLFPSGCLVCGSTLPYPSKHPDLLICSHCLPRINLQKRPFCSCCGKPFPDSSDPEHLCGGCLIRKKHFHKARAVILYTEPASRLIHSFKYHGSTVSLGSFAVLCQQANPFPAGYEPDFILPVPLHNNRLRLRGFNQSQVLAQTFFPGSRKKINFSILKRSRDTLSQAGLNGAERRKNLRNAFQVSCPDTIKGKKILLIDDVYTTGSTVNECSRILIRKGAQEVQVLTLARVLD